MLDGFRRQPVPLMICLCILWTINLAATFWYCFTCRQMKSNVQQVTIISITERNRRTAEQKFNTFAPTSSYSKTGVPCRVLWTDRSVDGCERQQNPRCCGWELWVTGSVLQSERFLINLSYYQSVIWKRCFLDIWRFCCNYTLIHRVALVRRQRRTCQSSSQAVTCPPV